MQLLNANPGGSPFVTGQNINVPFQYAAPIGPQPAPSVGPQPVIGPALPPVQPPPAGYGPGAVTVQPSSTYGTDDSWYAPTATAQLSPAAQPGIQAPPVGNTDYANTRAAQQYAANNTPFLKQMRWDPQARKFVSLGRLIKQGKLDLKGNWHKRSKRQKATAAANNRAQAVQQQAQEAAQDYTLSNSFISFNVSAG
jgi:hypothetical protein